MSEDRELVADQVQAPKGADLWISVTRYDNGPEIYGMVNSDRDQALANYMRIKPHDDRPVHRGLFKVRVPFDALEKVVPDVG